MRKTILSIYPAAIIACFLLLSACDRQVYDDLSACHRSVSLKIFSQTECAASPTYPSTEVIDVYAFDAKGLYVSRKSISKAVLSRDYRYAYPVPADGLYSFVVWANDAKVFTAAEPVPGKTGKQELLMTLRKNGDAAMDLSAAAPVYVGRTEKVLVQTGKEDAVAEANLEQLSNHINVRVEGVPHPENYRISFSAANGVYRADGVPAEEPVYQYPTSMSVPESGVAMADFYTLKLRSGHSNLLTVKEVKSGKTVFREDLLGAILLSPQGYNINFRCTHNFRVVLKMKKCECPVPPPPGSEDTYMVSELYVNSWLIHSYDVHLGRM